MKDFWNRNKSFRNVKIAVVFGLAQSCLIYIAYINLLWFLKNPTYFGNMDCN